MCGIAGFIDFRRTTSVEILESMVSTMPHRGPDDKGTEIIDCATACVGLAHVRLSIIDLTKGGHQPMLFENLWIVFNGEIYNYSEIKVELIKLDHTFQSNSDTEVILHAYKEWGSNMVHKLIGMFSILILDSDKQEVVIFRDRAGVKPFYYYWDGELFLFASELKAFHKHPDFNKVIDKDALYMYFKNVHHGYIPAPYTIFKNCYKLEPGCKLKLNLDTKEIEKKVYWSAESFYKKDKLKISYEEAKLELKNLLISACNYRMVADVPVGVFLSGGYDSTAVTAIIQNETINSLKTFTIGFEEGNNEAPDARNIANHLGTDHSEYICKSKDAQDIVPILPYYFDEPFADSSAIPTILVSQLAKEHVTVALSADAGDELFAGYESYVKLAINLKALDYIPNMLKSTLKVGGKLLQKFTPDKYINFKHRIKGVSNSLNTNYIMQAESLFLHMNSLPSYYTANLFSNKNTNKVENIFFDINGFSNPLEVALATDYKIYLQNDILTKVDRATMSTSLEGREPLLDHRLIEYVSTLPFEFKYDGNTTKKILKDIVHDYVPKHLMDRPKSGFTLPIYTWLMKDLAYLLEEYLSEDALAKSGLFNVNFVIDQVNLFKQGQYHYKPLIWKILMFQMWYRMWM